MDKIHSRSPFYLEVNAGEPTPAPQTIPIDCGGTHNVAADVGIVTYKVETPQIGTFRVDITGSDVPAKFTLKWDGNESTTDYIGLDTYDQDLLDAGVPIGEIATGATSTKADNFVEITKSAAQPELVELIVQAPLVNDEYTVDFTCPSAPPVVINQTTQINIWFDASGSMNTTLPPLRDMVSTNLKDCLISFYNGDSDEYDKYVTVREFGKTPYYNEFERTFRVGAWEPDVQDATNVINIVFQDEGGGVSTYSEYMPVDSVFNESLLRSTYTTDMNDIRDKLTNYPADYVTPIIFQVKRSNGNQAFKEFLQAAYSGTLTGSIMSGTNNLADLQSQVSIYYDINFGSTSLYYRDLVIQAINDLGFSVTCP